MTDMFPRERVAAVIRRWIAEGYSQGLISRLTGVAPRDIYRTLHGPSEYEIRTKHATGESVKLDTLDRLLCGMNQVHLFLLPPEQGGFSDIYLANLDSEMEEAA